MRCQRRAAFATGSGYNRKLIPYDAPFFGKVIGVEGLRLACGSEAAGRGRPALHQQVHGMLEPRLILVNLLIKLGQVPAPLAAFWGYKRYLILHSPARS